MNISNSDFNEDCNGELSNIALRYARKQVNEEGLNDDGNCNGVYQCDKNREEVQDSGVIMEAIDYCENKRSRLNSKRKRTENSDSNDNNKDINCGDNICDVSAKNNSINSCSNTKLTGIIGQYLLSRVPLPTTRSDLQKKFTKSEGNSSSKKINLDEILSNINDIFKSALGLGIFGLNKNIGTTSNPKYYIVQLNNSKSYLNSIYKYGYINYKHIGELSPYQNEAENFVSPKLCNNFVSFLSFLFGFFSITSYINDNKNKNEDNSERGSDICEEETNQKVEKLNDDDIEISNGKSFILSFIS
ncbi:hypothetical protein FG379_000886 [Cryptosporidium bovis]|uniref:uncharacterized protein n=1 Tax=Cryptosporidium bovis TaxID=310047 RepID=UPI00351A78D2|nr:hypothetical protein FG379_000886 [Cryptosporidium bovis]